MVTRVTSRTIKSSGPVIKRKHTANAKRVLPGLAGEIVEPLAEAREKQRQTFRRYSLTALTGARADHAIMEMYWQRIINVQRIAEVERQWQEPEFEEWGSNTVWRLFNAATFTLNGRAAENPTVTRKLHNVIDGVCTAVH